MNDFLQKLIKVISQHQENIIKAIEKGIINIQVDDQISDKAYFLQIIQFQENPNRIKSCTKSLSQAHKCLGYIYEEEKNIQKAAINYLESISLDFNQFQLFDNIGSLFYKYSNNDNDKLFDAFRCFYETENHC